MAQCEASKTDKSFWTLGTAPAPIVDLYKSKESVP